jgi:hypothetical protein
MDKVDQLIEILLDVNALNALLFIGLDPKNENHLFWMQVENLLQRYGLNIITLILIYIGRYSPLRGMKSLII